MFLVLFDTTLVYTEEGVIDAFPVYKNEDGDLFVVFVCNPPTGDVVDEFVRPMLLESGIPFNYDDLGDLKKTSMDEAVTFGSEIKKGDFELNPFRLKKAGAGDSV